MFANIRKIKAEDTYALRNLVLRPGLPVETVQFTGDHEALALHLGFFDDDSEKPIGALTALPQYEDESLAVNGEAYRLRGMAVHPEHQRRGIGRALLEVAMLEFKKTGTKILWCNARSHVLSLYEAFGLKTVGEEFDIPNGGPHFKMIAKLKSSE